MKYVAGITLYHPNHEQLINVNNIAKHFELVFVFDCLVSYNGRYKIV